MFKDYFHFARSNHHFLLFGLLTAFFGNYGQSFFIAWFGQSFQAAFNLSNAEYGMAYSGATLLSGFIILYVGALLDKTPLKKFTLLTSIGLISACFLLYTATAIWQLLLAIFMLRFCGQGLMFHIAFTSMARYFEHNRGKAIGIVAFGMPLGEAILPAIAVLLISHIGWRETWLLLGLVLAVFFIPTFYWLLAKSKRRLNREAQPAVDSVKKQVSGWSRKQVIKDKGFWLLIPAIISPAFIITGIFIHQSVLLQTKNWSTEWFALCFALYAFSHLKSSLVFGSLVDKYSARVLLRYYLAPIFLGVVLLALPFEHPFIATLFMFLIGLTVGASGPIVGSLWVEIYGSSSIAAIRSMVTSIMVVSTAVSPVLFGFFLDQIGNYSSLMMALCSYLILAWFLVDRFALKKSLVRPPTPRS